MLLERINQQLAGVALEDIHFVIDISLGRPVVPKKAPLLAPAGPDRGRLEQFENMVSALPDEAMRASLKNLWVAFQK
jgi:hypothetical protein